MDRIIAGLPGSTLPRLSHGRHLALVSEAEREYNQCPSRGKLGVLYYRASYIKRAHQLTARLGSGRIPVSLLACLLIVGVVFFSCNILRIISRIPFLLFFPGYTLTTVLLTKKEGTGGIERIASSFGSIMAVVPLVGLIFDYTPWGNRARAYSPFSSFIPHDYLNYCLVEMEKACEKRMILYGGLGDNGRLG